MKGLVWVVNKGQLLSMCGDDTIYLLDVRQREVEIVQLIKFNKERLTAINLAVNSNWVFVGTDKGNTHVLRLGNAEPSVSVLVNGTVAATYCLKVVCISMVSCATL